MTFWTDDVDAAYARMTTAGVETLGPPEKADRGSAIGLRGPDGNTFVLSSG